jgi:hypothetical protein
VPVARRQGQHFPQLAAAQYPYAAGGGFSFAVHVSKIIFL